MLRNAFRPGQLRVQLKERGPITEKKERGDHLPLLLLILLAFSSLNHYLVLHTFNLPKFCSHILSPLSSLYFLTIILVGLGSK